MKNFLRYAILIFCISYFPNYLMATHNRAGEIFVEQIGECTDLRLRATIITYTKASSTAADRDTLTLCWGDGFCEQVSRSNGPGSPGQGVNLGNDIQINIYVSEHKFPAPGNYKISMTDPNRNGGILNVNPPGSENVQFHLQTTFKFLNCQSQGSNTTPKLLKAPIEFACKGQKFTHNPTAFDIDNDRLTYELIVPYQDCNIQVPNFIWPQNVSGNNPNEPITIDPENGTICWESPMVEGEYNIAFNVISWRGGVPIDTTVRDMQIFVEDCDDNKPPVIETIDEICVIAGEKVNFEIVASDPDNDQIKLSALGGPFFIETSPASNFGLDWDEFNSGGLAGMYGFGPFARDFEWQTTCEHIREQPYTVVFKVVDNVFDTSGLATLKVVNIKVVGPRPQDVKTSPSSEFIDVNWELPYVCENAADGYFRGFSVWRREGSNIFSPDDCIPGLEGKGYTRVKIRTNEVLDGRYTYKDEDVERGRTYCYRILAEFAFETASNFPQLYNLVESLPSDEICVQLSRDVPLLTNVSVDVTDPDDGEILIRWTKPDAEDLDTLLNKGPYVYDLVRLIDGSEEVIFSAMADEFWQANDTFFIDKMIDTENRQYNYELDFYVNNELEPLGTSPDATSVFLNVASTDETNILTWDYDTPWNNFQFDIFRLNPFNMTVWDSIGTTIESSFADEGLVNGRKYFYYIRTTGSYGVDGIPSPLINLSQENCGIPLDTIPPCPPLVEVRNLCDENISCQDDPLLENNLTWQNPNFLCEETDDVVGYNVYYAPREGDDFQLIASFDDSSDTTFAHAPEMGIAGCYAVTAIDTFSNESKFSPIVCVDNCPNYNLPNAFTPNADTQNDLFIPYPYCFIDHIELQVFNRWGNVVFATNDPDINWGGTNLKNKDLPEGTYYYTCKVFEERVSGIEEAPEILNGYIELIRSPK